MKLKPLFQFSLIEDKSRLNELHEAVKKLGGMYDESKTYNPKATHLIVDKMDCSEKLLCFIVSGKWILSRSYIDACLDDNGFVDETNHLILNRHSNSKLASVSFKWKEKIDKGKNNSPFTRWNVACFLKDDVKGKALLRILKAGNGSGVLMSDKNTRKEKENLFTLVVTDDKMRDKALVFANERNLLCYPVQAIPDYVMQCVANDKPILPMKYYNNLLNKDDHMEIDLEKVDNKQEIKFLGMYITHLLYFNLNKKSLEVTYVNSNIEDQFKNLWTNNAYMEAFDLLTMIDTDMLLNANTLIFLFEFLLDGNINKMKNYVYQNQNIPNEKSFNELYNKVYLYIYNKMLTYPPLISDITKYFTNVFESLILRDRIEYARSYDAKGLVDVIYLMSLYDYLILNTNSKEKSYQNCLILLCKLDDDQIKIKLIELLIRDKNTTSRTYMKMLQIIAFCHAYYKSSELYARSVELIFQDEINLINKLSSLTDTSNPLLFESLFTNLIKST